MRISPFLKLQVTTSAKELAELLEKYACYVEYKILPDCDQNGQNLCTLHLELTKCTVEVKNAIESLQMDYEILLEWYEEVESETAKELMAEELDVLEEEIRYFETITAAKIFICRLQNRVKNVEQDLSRLESTGSFWKTENLGLLPDERKQSGSLSRRSSEDNLNNVPAKDVNSEESVAKDDGISEENENDNSHHKSDAENSDIPQLDDNNRSRDGNDEETYHIVNNDSSLALDRMSADMAVELKPYEVAIVSLWPGMVRTEYSLLLRDEHKLSKMVQMSEEVIDRSFKQSESPEFVGKAVVALASDKKVINKSGKIMMTYDVARDYGFKDIDGKMPMDIRRVATALQHFGFDRLAAFVPSFIRIPLWALHFATYKFPIRIW